jgi:hypothetical protein
MESTMKNFNNQRLETLHQEAKRYAQLESLRQQDRATLTQALSALLEIAKHWTIGITLPQRYAPRKTT